MSKTIIKIACALSTGQAHWSWLLLFANAYVQLKAVTIGAQLDQEIKPV